MLVLFDTQAAQQGCGVAFGIVSAHFRELFFQFGHFDTVFVRKVGFGIKRIALLHDVPQYGVSHQYGIQHGTVVILEVVLAQYGEPFARSQFHTAFGRFQFARYGFQQRGLPGSVSPDDTVNISIGELHVYILVQDSFPELDGKIRYANHTLNYTLN